MSCTAWVAVRLTDDEQVRSVAIIYVCTIESSPLELNSTVCIVSDCDILEDNKAQISAHDTVLAASVAEMIFVDGRLIWRVAMEDTQAVITDRVRNIILESAQL